MFSSGVVFCNQRLVRGIRDSSHIIIGGPTRNTLAFTLAFTTLRYVSRSLTDSYPGRQPPIQPVLPLAAWGGQSPWGTPAARSLAIAGTVVGVSNSSGILQRTVCPRNSGFIPHHWRPQETNTRFLRLCTCLEFFETFVFRHAATDAANVFASSVGWAHPTLGVRCPPVARFVAITGECAIVRPGVTICNYLIAFCTQDFGIHQTYILVNRRTTTRTLRKHYCCLYGFRKCLQSLLG